MLALLGIHEPQNFAGEVEKLHAKIGQRIIERELCQQPPVSFSALEVQKR